MKSCCICFLIAVLILSSLSAAAFAAPEIGHAPFSISDMYIFEPFDTGEEMAQVAGNADYVERIQALTQPCDAQCETESLLFSAETMLLCDDMTAFTWSVQNRTDKTLYIMADAEGMNYRNIMYDLFGGFNWNSYTIAPGETLHARFRGWLWEHAEPGAGEFCMPVSVYSVPEGVTPEFENGSEVFYDPAKLVLKENTSLVFPAEMREGEGCAAEGLPLEVKFEDYSLRVTKAVLKDISVEFAYERIYPSKEAALENSPAGYESYWGYTFNSDGGTHWIHAGFGSIPDDPVRLEDGRWAWQMSYKVYSMYARPEKIEFTPYVYTTEGGKVNLPAEAITLEFQLEKDKV